MQKSASAGTGGQPAAKTASSAGQCRPPSAPANRSSAIPSGNGITAANVSAGRTADADVDLEAARPANRGGVVHADAAVDLVVQPDLAFRHIVIARKLDPVHAEVGSSPAGSIRVLGVNNGKG